MAALVAVLGTKKEVSPVGSAMDAPLMIDPLPCCASFSYLAKFSLVMAALVLAL